MYLFDAHFPKFEKKEGNFFQLQISYGHAEAIKRYSVYFFFELPEVLQGITLHWDDEFDVGTQFFPEFGSLDGPFYVKMKLLSEFRSLIL